MHRAELKNRESRNHLPGYSTSHHGQILEDRLTKSDQPKAGGDPHDQPANDHDLATPVGPPGLLLTLLLLLGLEPWTLLPSQASAANPP